MYGSLSFYVLRDSKELISNKHEWVNGILHIISILIVPLG